MAIYQQHQTSCTKNFWFPRFLYINTAGRKAHRSELVRWWNAIRFGWYGIYNTVTATHTCGRWVRRFPPFHGERGDQGTARWRCCILLYLLRIYRIYGSPKCRECLFAEHLKCQVFQQNTNTSVHKYQPGHPNGGEKKGYIRNTNTRTNSIRARAIPIVGIFVYMRLWSKQ